MTSHDQTYQAIVEAAAGGLRKSGKVPEVSDLVAELGIPRREFYRHFRNKAALSEKMIRESDQTYFNVAEIFVDSASTAQDKIRNFLRWRMVQRVWCAEISRPDDLKALYQDRIEYMLRGLLRELHAGRVLGAPRVYQTATEILEANDRLADDLCSELSDEVHFEYVAEAEGLGFSEEGIRLCDELFDVHWAFVSKLLPMRPAPARSQA
ncbi:TetR/AcrR family transcriptional regulator [Lichenibacterium ramalinae]|uniref:TetR family transcriptional regulator n=1 Tax=Lichenibacterium ramalinae TaxID=2316527 RepID=A0A4Q2REB9_9HYPH|nr:TetR family transcriptional regulator [Lichenibacterium ramalinae]RYB04464.1 TetR family transcriptional regulator [Lichenibacterium ramalinae]